ncbi:glycerol-3-phosphate dehydrogenase/oxidase [Limnovirga soli]|uniref:FAD-dependent oxidoreductase n=1 Tax=Limnovirga soli TaxID=2656915 RepID=A0A8J8JVB9_9BACT|nr:glycerol-3-phosphate dehydrogenase/oxidase [Limnovirga soli]NNV57230.1 FAD-dependent oxidoreductase [Limnovirga soli]
MNREHMLQQLAATEEWDIIIIGGGATGLGAAVDATTRGYKTLLIEKYDFAKGTSSRSTKLVHGGVRYLAQGNIKLVMEALRERGYLLQNASHLADKAAFVVPAYSFYDKWFYGIGLKVYDILAGKLSIGKTRILNKKQTVAALPGINAAKLSGGILYYDGQFDDTRLAVELAVTAAENRATIINYCSATALVKKDNRVCGVIAEDTVNNVSYTLQAKAVINATGVFTDAIMQMDEPEEEKMVAPSQGIHLVVDKHFFPGNNAMMIPKTDDGRVLFAVPWHNKVVLGTTDTPLNEISFEPTPLEEEIAFVLHHANLYLEKEINRSDVRSMFAGLRPLVQKKGAKTTSMLSRDHTILVSKAGLVTVTGGKWTTYRKMAEDVVNNAAFVAKLPKQNCITKTLPIGKAKNKPNSVTGTELLQTPNTTITTEAITQFVLEEMAVTLEDVLARRTRVLFLDAQAAIELAPMVANTMAALLGKNEEWIATQVADFTRVANQYVLS